MLVRPHSVEENYDVGNYDAGNYDAGREGRNFVSSVRLLGLILRPEVFI